jgi:hypothetical protein
MSSLEVNSAFKDKLGQGLKNQIEATQNEMKD